MPGKLSNSMSIAEKGSMRSGETDHDRYCRFLDKCGMREQERKRPAATKIGD